MNKVSVVIPAYNSSRTIVDTIRSVTNQSYRNIEIIVVNDGSTDNTGDIVRQLSNVDSRIRIIDKENEGVSIARNICIREASGEFITFVDSDDWLEKDYIEILLTAILSNKADVAKCSLKYLTNDHKRIRVRQIPDVICAGVQAYGQFLCGKGWASSACASLYNLEFLRKNNILFPSGIPVGEDGVFTMMVLLKSAKIVSINKPLLNVSVREMSASRSGAVYDISHQIVDKIDGSSEFKDLRESYKLRVITSNLLRTAYRASYDGFRKTYLVALSENYAQINTALNRKKLNAIMKLASFIAKSPSILFFAIRFVKVLGFKPLF